MVIILLINKLFRKVKANLINSKGMALMATIIFTFVLSTMAIALLSMTSNDIKLSALQEESHDAFYLADSGINVAINWLERERRSSPPSSDDIPTYLQGNYWIDVYDFNNQIDKNAELDPGQYYRVTFSVLPPSEYYQAYKIVSIGKLVTSSRNNIKTIEQVVDATSFAEYAYFSHFEASGVYFTSNDVIDGRLHTNGTLRIDGSPTFKGLVTSAEDSIVWDDGEPSEQEKEDIFWKGYRLGADEYIALPEATEDIAGPDNPESLQSIAMGGWTSPGSGVHVPHDLSNNITGGIYVDGSLKELKLKTENGLSVMEFTQRINYYTDITTTITLLPAGSTDPYSDTPITSDKTVIQKGTDEPIYYNGLPNGLLYVDGAINSLKGTEDDGGHQGKLTIAADGDITITDDIKYKSLIDNPDIDIHTDNPDDLSQIDDTLGIISTGDVILDILSGNSNPIVCATIMALGESMYNDNNYRTPPGIFTLFGGLIQVRRGIMGHHSTNYYGEVVQTSGYAKDYNYDERMRDLTSGAIPPYFPTTGKYEPVYWTDRNVTIE